MTVASTRGHEQKIFKNNLDEPQKIIVEQGYYFD